MLIEFRNSDRLLGVKALGIYGKAIDAAVAACQKVYAPTLFLDGERVQSEAAADWLNDALEEMGAGESRELEMPAALVLPLRNAASLYLSELSKLAEKQGGLLVPMDETQEVMSHVTSLADRLRGQMELEGTVTMQFGDSRPVTIPTERFHRMAEDTHR